MMGTSNTQASMFQYTSIDMQNVIGAQITDEKVVSFSNPEIGAGGVDQLQDLLSPSEVRPLVAAIMARSASSKAWLDFAVRVLPVRAMTPAERKALVDDLSFVSTKSALEFVSENRQYLDTADVKDVTHDYSRTIEPHMCLHLTHRNSLRQSDYFSDDQIEIFRGCAKKH